MPQLRVKNGFLAQYNANTFHSVEQNFRLTTPPMFNKILFGIIGALAALLVFVLAVMLLTPVAGFQIVAVIELGLNIIVGCILWKKFKHNEIAKAVGIGVLISSIVYLLLIFIAKTVVFSLLSGITS